MKKPLQKREGREGPAERPWSVPLPVSDVLEAGRRAEIEADAPVRAAIAALAGVRDLPRLQASFDVTRDGRGGLRVTGRVCATVGQICVVTLEPMQTEIDEPVDLIFTPPGGPSALDLASAGAAQVEVSEDTPEPLVGGAVDLGALATEFLILALDPYPRKPGAAFAPPAARDEGSHPFAALQALKQRQQRE